ncbi:hypothetical protein Tco_0319429 [Tanacetum coccineum]
MRQALTDRLRMEYTRAEGQVSFTRLHTDEEMARDGFKAYWAGSLRGIADKGDLSDYWARISSDGEFLRVAPLYISIIDPLRRLCHRLIVVSISGMGQAPQNGRKRGARLFGGHFVGRLAEYFGLFTEEGLQGLIMVVGEHRVIDMDELARLRMCERLGDTWAWVAPRPERQLDAAAGTLEVAESALYADEGAQIVPAPVQAPQPPPVIA